MRLIQLVLALSVSSSILACAPEAKGPRPINVAVVRHEIDDAIGGARQITSVGHVTEDRAVVYTANDAKVRAEETWVRTSSGWKLDHTAALSSL